MAAMVVGARVSSATSRWASRCRQVNPFRPASRQQRKASLWSSINRTITAKEVRKSAPRRLQPGWSAPGSNAGSVISLGLLLHIYQPPDRFDDLLHRVVRESHRPLLRLLQARPDARVSLNLNWCLTEKWLEKGFEDCVESLDSLLRWERVELTGSAAYHPILPLIPRHEIRRQISYNSERHQEVFSSWKPRGFFPPELAFGHELPPVLVDLGFEWCLADDIPYTCLHDVPPFDFVPVCADLPVLLRSSLWSKTFEACARHGADGKALARKLVDDLQAAHRPGEAHVQAT